MAATEQVPKSILKKPKTRPNTRTTKPAPTPSDPTILDSILDSIDVPVEDKSDRQRDLSRAIQHATRLQSRKDVEALILANTETLLDYPTSSAPASSPSASDAEAFLKMVEPFTPNDYVEMRRERYCAGLCGYALCGNQHRKSDSSRGKWKIGGRGGGGGVVERSTWESWCSDACARRAMHVQVHLDKMPAWLRDGEPKELKLLQEKNADDVSELEPGRQVKLAIRPKEKVEEWQKTLLAQERGNGKIDTIGEGLLKERIVEKKVTRPAIAPNTEDADPAGAVEGYNTRPEVMSDLARPDDGDFDLAEEARIWTERAG